MRPDASPSVVCFGQDNVTNCASVGRRRRRGHRSWAFRILRFNHRFARPSTFDVSDNSCLPPVGGPSQAGPEPTDIQFHNFLTILHCNIRGWLSHRDELVGHFASIGRPAIIFLNETLLNESVENPALEEYILIGRHEAACNKRGAAVYAHFSIAPDVVLLKKSVAAERLWIVAHTQLGPLLLCSWYRSPCRGETSSISFLRVEYNELKVNVVGTAIIGDLNVHQKRWLEFSSENMPEGNALQGFCADHGFEELVKAPTRGENLLDLVLSDVPFETRTSVLPGVSDHSMVLTHFDTPIQLQQNVVRTVWQYSDARRSELRSALAAVDWRYIDQVCPSAAAEWFASTLMGYLQIYIPRKEIVVKCSAHPWFNNACIELVKQKREAWGTPQQAEVSERCSVGMLAHYYVYVEATKGKLRQLKRGSKAWWRLSKQLMHKATSHTCIPALRIPNSKEWARSPVEKANLLADTFARKWQLPPPVLNIHSYEPPVVDAHDALIPIRTRRAGTFLSSLHVSSATGPDDISARVLRSLHDVLCLPFAKLARCIVNGKEWPRAWTVHWICALFKRNAMSDPENYRGIQLTAQIARKQWSVSSHLCSCLT